MQRGDLTIWFTPEVIAAWQPRGDGLRGGQRRYSDVAIEAALALRLMFRLPWRQTEGLLASIFKLLDLRLRVPDHTTLSRRSRASWPLLGIPRPSASVQRDRGSPDQVRR